LTTKQEILDDLGSEIEKKDENIKNLDNLIKALELRLSTRI